MTFRTCSCEEELTRALKDGHWPEGCTPELRAHVAGCASCVDLVLVTQTMQGARAESRHEALPGAANLLWWKAQLRQRNAATERVSRPITIAEIFAFCVMLLVAVIFVASQYRHGLRWAEWLPELAPWRALHFSSAATGWGSLLLISGLGVLALLSGIVVYLVAEKS